MPIIPRTNPEAVGNLSPLPGVRNTTRVSSSPVEGVADAVRQSVADINEVYQREAARADTAAYMEAQNQISAWRATWNDPNNAKGVGAYKGRDALKLTEAMLPDYDSRVSDIANTLPSERARRQFLTYAADTRGQVHEDINRYATAQNNAYLAQQRKAYLETQKNDLIGAQLADPARYAQKWAATLDTIHADAAANGDAPEATSLTIANLQSGVHAGVIDQLLSRDPLAAKDYYAEHADELQEADRARVLRTLEPLWKDARGEADADAILPGGAMYVPHANPQRDYAGLASKYGLTITSTTRSAAENAKVGGVANSQHVAGTAADFRTQGVPEEKIAAFMADARAAGYEVIDERQHTNGTGPHIHVELPPSGRAGQGRVSTEADALERLSAFRDPERRRIAEAKVRDRIAIDKLRRAEAEREASERINTAVWTGDPTRPLAEVLGKDDYAYAAGKGWIGALTNDLKYRVGETARADDPAVVGAYLAQARENAQAFAKMDVMRNARHMTEATAKELVQRQADIRAGKFDPAEAGSESEQLNALVFGPLGMVGQKDAQKKKRAEFETQWYRVKANWTAANPGKPLDATARDGLIRRLRASFALNAGKGDIPEAFDKFAMTDNDRAAIVQALRAQGVASPSEQQIRRTYLIGVAQ